MSTKYSAGVVLLLATVLFALGAIQAAAAPAGASDAGTGPDNALPPPPGTVTLAAGQRVWYVFQYTGDGSQILVDMAATPPDSATFHVWTPGNVRDWAAGNGEHPVGEGGANSAVNGEDLVWSGNFKFPGTFYVVVDQTGPHTGTYTLQISGDEVSFPTLTGRPTPAPAAPPAAADGTGPDTALPLPTLWMNINPGQRVWYAFHYAGDGSQISIQLSTDPRGCATFGVWTQDGVAKWESEGIDSPIGVGTVNPNVNGGDLFWSSSFNTPGTYYVVVDQASQMIGMYLLQVSGSGVSSK